jgi:ParB family chromosome partitioning protein
MKLIKEFNLKHTEVAKKVGRSREYVSNSVRILGLPQEMLDALVAGKITEGHTRPLLMLIDRPAEQMTLFKDITARRLTVREAEAAARRVAIERVRKIDAFINPELYAVEERLSQKFGTKVKVEKKDQGGRLTIAFFSPEDLNKILSLIEQPSSLDKAEVMAETPVGTEDLPAPIDDSTADDELYSIRNFSL